MYKRGLTAIELVIVFGIMGILVSIVTTSFSGFRNNSILSVETENIVSLISQARTDTLSSKDDTVYGVHFETDRAVLFKGTTFTEPSADNIEIELDQKVELSTISLNGGGDDVVFKRLSGKTDEHGTITISLTDNASSSRMISIYTTGLVDVNQ